MVIQSIQIQQEQEKKIHKQHLKEKLKLNRKNVNEQEVVNSKGEKVIIGKSDLRTRSLGTLAVLDDLILMNVIFCDFTIQELLKCQCVSPGFYVFLGDDRLWKDSFLRDIKGRKEPVRYLENWKISALQYHYPGAIENFKLPYVPLHFPDFYSHEIYTRWLRRHMNVKQYGIDSGHIEHIDVDDLTLEQFIERFEKPSIPVVFKGAQRGTGLEKGEWSEQRLLERYGDVTLKISHQQHKRIPMTFRDYCSYMKVQTDEEPLYVFDQSFGEKAPTLLGDYQIPKYFPEDLFKHNGEEHRPHFRWIVIGPERSGASWHIDPAGTSAWNSLVSGKKRWLLYPPNFTPYTVDLENIEEKIYGSPPSLLWLLEVYPYLPPDYRPVECIQEPGETIFVPGGWWHMVLNMEQSIAVTQNFCDSQNFQDVCHDLANGDVKDYTHFKEKLLAAKPEFQDKFARFEYKNDQHRHSFDEQEYWYPMVKSILKNHSLEFADDSTFSIETPTSGQSPVFIVNEKYVVKFYCSELGGEKSWSTELYLYDKFKCVPTLTSTFPKLLASGNLKDIEPSIDIEWKWPYIVTEYLVNTSNIQYVQPVPDSLPYPYPSPPDEEDDEDDDEDEEEEDIEIAEDKLINFLVDNISLIHSIEINDGDDTATTSNEMIKQYREDKWLPWKNQLKVLESRYISNHWNWNGLPVHLRSEMKSYLPLDINDLIDHSFEPCFIHADLTDENVLGTENTIETKVFEKVSKLKIATTPSQKLKLKKQVTKSQPLLVEKIIKTTVWEANHLIDLGDSLIADRWYELISLHISVFALDKSRLKSFLSKYKINTGTTGNTTTWYDLYCKDPKSFIKRAMQYTLIHHCDAITTASRHNPEIRNSKSIDDLSNLIWNLDTI